MIGGVLGEFVLGEYTLPTADQAILDNYYNWQVNWFHKSGGRKKNFYIGMDDVPIQQIDFELNKKICGAGKIKMAFVNFPIDADDYVEAYYNGTLKYRAIVDNSVDPKGGDVKLVPYSQRFSELLLNEDYSSQTIESMIEDIIEDNQIDTDVGYNSAFIDTGESDLYSFNFDYKPIADSLKQILDKLDDREWGVLPSNTFTIYANNSSADYILTDETERGYVKVEKTTNYERIKETQREVFKKDNAGDKQHIGLVGGGASSDPYPVLDIQTLVRKKVKTYDISESDLSSTDALDIAYADLQKIATLGETTKITDIDINKYDLDIGEYVKVIDGYEQVLETIIDCDSVTDWTGATLDNDDYVEGSGSIQGNGYNPSNSIITYDFGEVMRFNNPEFIQFMVKTAEIGNSLEFSLAENSSELWDTTHDIYINTANVWQTVTCDISNESTFQFFAVRYTQTLTVEDTQYLNNLGISVLGEFFQQIPASVTFNIDRVQIYHYSKNTYEGAVVQLNYKIDKFGTHVNVKLNDYTEQANEENMNVKNRLEKIDTIQKQ